MKMAKSYRDTPPITLLRSIMRSAQTLSHWSLDETKRMDLPGGEFDVIATLGNTDGLRMCDLAERMLTSPPNVTRIIKSLEERGLVERFRNPQSDREVIARLTPAGVTLFEACYPKMYAFWKEKLGKLYSTDEQKQLAQLLERLYTQQ
jgi:MarR family transcriptional regulator, 2-MHQ and catechol-resistance regulon repressor